MVEQWTNNEHFHGGTVEEMQGKGFTGVFGATFVSEFVSEVEASRGILSPEDFC